MGLRRRFCSLVVSWMMIRDVPEGVHRSRLLVDGYNVLFGQGWASPSQRCHLGLRRGRETLAERLASRIAPVDRSATWIVFDSLDAPSHLPSSLRMHDMEVVFSRGWSNADELLQHILTFHPHPKALVVLSSDHAVQRKAVARKARPYDHDRWEDAIEAAFGNASLPPSGRDEPDETAKNEVLSSEERDAWMKRFGF